MTPLPRVLAFTPPRGPVDPERIDAIAAAIGPDLGVALVLRTPGVSTPPSAPRVREAVSRARSLGWLVLGSAALCDVDAAGSVDGHIIRSGAEWPNAPGLWGRSVHVGDAIESAATFDCFAPVFEPRTDPQGKRPAGLAALRSRCRLTSRPVYALGGITPARIEPCFEAGAHGVAAIGALFEEQTDLGGFGAAMASCVRTFFG